MAKQQEHLRLAVALTLLASAIVPLAQAREEKARDAPNTSVTWPPVKGGATQNFVSNYEIGTLFDEYYDYRGYDGKQPCFEAPPNSNWAERPEVVDTTVPCAAMRAFFANCSLGISLAQEGSDPVLDKYPEAFQEIPNDQQQQCYCNGDYWLYNAGCNACLKLHGYPANGEGWIPSEYVSQQSSAYCTAQPTVNFREFLDAFQPQTTVSPTPDADRGVQGFFDTATAANQTGVSAYFSAPTSTPVFLTGTSSVSLATYSETIASKTSSSATPTSNVAGRITGPAIRYWPAAIGVVAVL